ncbi:transcription initiation factor TFIID TATA-box-binding protein [Acrasis kona]|uniref:Transcription initiation factor TFIID TATA-box-binding protein n=1 Tax=Acrasis kona TaxID=1008807 RepID=A0AAW2Z5L7_9EUKA
MKEVYEKNFEEGDDGYDPLEHAKQLIDDEFHKELNGGGKQLSEVSDGVTNTNSSQILPERQNEDEDESTLTITNVVSSVDLKCKIDLKTVALHMRNAEYNPKKFSGAVMRLAAPKSCGILFASGRLNCTGCKNEEDSRLACRKFARILQLLGYQPRFSKFQIVNFMATLDLGFPLRLQRFYEVTMKKESNSVVNYEPEIFPGVIYFMKNKITLLIFVSGKVTVTGAKERRTIEDSVKDIKSLLTPFKKGSDAEEFDNDDIY